MSPAWVIEVNQVILNLANSCLVMSVRKTLKYGRMSLISSILTKMDGLHQEIYWKLWINIKGIILKEIISIRLWRLMIRIKVEISILGNFWGWYSKNHMKKILVKTSNRFLIRSISTIKATSMLMTSEV